MSNATLPSESPSVQDIYGIIANGCGVTDCVALEDDESERAALECDGLTPEQQADLAAYYAENPEPLPTDDEIDKMYAEHQAEVWREELDQLKTEFMAAYTKYVEYLAECDRVDAQEQMYAKVAAALGAA